MVQIFIYSDFYLFLGYNAYIAQFTTKELVPELELEL
jgi:hypothetical protein